MADDFNITSVGSNPADERAHRMRFYFLSMALRMACILSLFWVRGWWLVIPILGAIFLPYFAVMIANATENTGAGPGPEKVTPAELMPAEQSASISNDKLIVIDAPADRRQQGERIPD